MKKHIALLILIGICLLLLPAASADGYCGENLTWTREGSVLTISGTGAMEDYSDKNTAPWMSQYYDPEGIKTVVIEEGVTSIGDHAFDYERRYLKTKYPQEYGYKHISFDSITIPKSVTRIGTCAFANAIASITLHDNIPDIGAGAFLHGPHIYTSLGSVTAKALGDESFYDTGSGWEYQYIYEDGRQTGLKIIELNTKASTDLVIPDGVTEIIGGFPDDVTSVVFPETVTDLGAWAFSGCNKLKRVTIPGKVTGLNKGTFEDCTALQAVNLPACLESIGDSAFQGCGNLQSIALPATLTQIGESAFEGCGSLQSITVPGGAEMVSEGAFRDCGGLKSAVIQKGVKEIGEEAFAGCAALAEVSIPATVTEIDPYAFKGSGLVSVTIPEGVTAIWKGAFSECAQLRQASLPKGLETLNYECFSDCTALEEITIPGSVSYIADQAFFKCTGMKKAIIQEGVTHIGEGAFADCSALAEISIPGTVTTIDKLAFCGICAETVTIPESVTEIGEGAFYDNKKLQAVNIPKSLKSLPDGIFMDCTALKEVTVPCSIGEKSFAGCTGLATVTVTGGYVIGTGAFNGCSGLKTVTITEPVRYIEDSAFIDCKALETIVIPASVTEIHDDAFWNIDYDKLTMYVTPGSYAEQYAINGGYRYSTDPPPKPEDFDITRAEISPIQDQVYTGKKLKPAVTVTLNGRELEKGKDYKIAWKNNKAVGIGIVTVTGIGDYNGTQEATFRIIPKKVTLSKLTTVKKKLTIAWKKGKGIDGYEIEYGLKKNFKGAKKITIKKAATVKKTVSGLKSGKTYYVRIRAWKKAGGKKYYSAWSAVLKKKIK